MKSGTTDALTLKVEGRLRAVFCYIISVAVFLHIFVYIVRNYMLAYVGTLCICIYVNLCAARFYLVGPCTVLDCDWPSVSSSHYRL